MKLVKHLFVAAIAFTLGIVLSTALYVGVAYSQTVRVHWTKREKYIQYKTHAIQLVSHQ